MVRPMILASGAILLLLFVGSPSSGAREMPQDKGGHAAKKESASQAMGDAGHVIEEEAHGHASPGDPDILEFKPSLMISTVIVFVALLLVLWKYAWGPLTLALQERERKQEETIRQAELARSESERLLAEHKKQMDAAAESVRQMLDDARRQADANTNTILQKAQAEAEAVGERAKRDIDTAREQALTEIWSKTAEMAVSVAGKVLSKEMSHDDHRRLVESASNELPSLSGANGHGGNRA